MSNEAELLRELDREVAAIAEYVAELRMTIDSLRAPEIAGQRLPGMRTELSEVHDSTRLAADSILDTAEDLLVKASTGELDAAYIEAKMLGLMEACSFQDLTGQRLRRTQDMLNAIEDRLCRFVERAGAANAEPGATDVEKRLEQRNAVRMTHGPGDASALQQTDIDHILRSA